jgi:hypothetical protein
MGVLFAALTVVVMRSLPAADYSPQRSGVFERPGVA